MNRLAMTSGAAALLLAGAARAAPPAAAPPPEQHVRGVIAALDGDRLEIKVPGGKRVQVELAADAHLTVAVPADLASVGPGLFVGTTAVAQPDGSLRALEVHLFPESMRGLGAGHRPWDLRPGSSMTNATVSAVQAAPAPPAGSSMTNATVTRAASTPAGLKLTLQDPSGQRTVLVPPGVPVVRLEPADRSRLVAGAHVFAAGPRQADGVVLVQRLVVGQGTLRPPM